MKKAEGESPILEGKQSFVMLTPIGPLTGVEECGAMTALSFGGVPDAQQAPTPLLAELAKQLAEYFLKPAFHRFQLLPLCCKNLLD